MRVEIRDWARARTGRAPRTRLGGAWLVALATFLTIGCASPAAPVAPTVVSATPTVVPPPTALPTAAPTATPGVPTPRPAPPTPTATPVAAPSSLPTASPTVEASPTVPPTWKTYVSKVYGVSLQYPSTWQRDPRYTLPNQERYTGSDGFVQLSASGARSLDAAADLEAHHQLQPYGSKPTVTPLEVGGQEARLILPSADQPREMAGQAALIVASPRPIFIGDGTYPYLVLWADQAHIHAIAATLRWESG